MYFHCFAYTFDAGDDRGSDMSDCMEDEVIDDESDSAGAILCDAE